MQAQKELSSVTTEHDNSYSSSSQSVSGAVRGVPSVMLSSHPSSLSQPGQSSQKAFAVTGPVSSFGIPPQQRPPLPQKVLFDPEKEVKNFWPRQMEKIEALTDQNLREATKAQLLPLARIKKIMKIDDVVKAQMISAEAPVLFAKAAEIFIEELTLRSWVHTEDNKRKTLQKNDLAMAISKYEMFDFLIDIVPREEVKPEMQHTRRPEEALQQPGSPVLVQNIENGQQMQYLFCGSGPGGAQQLQAIQLPSATSVGQNMQSMTSSQVQVQLQNGQVVQATPVAPTVQFQALPGQTMQLITPNQTPAGQPIQLQVINANALQLAETEQNDEN